MPVMQTTPPLGFAHLSESSSEVVPMSSSTCHDAWSMIWCLNEQRHRRSGVLGPATLCCAFVFQP